MRSAPGLAMQIFEKDYFQQRLAMGLARVSQALQGARRPYIAFSSGKDSVVVAALVHAIAPNVELYWSDDELEYPETVEYMTSLKEIAGPQLTITLGYALHARWFWPWRDKPFYREPLLGSLSIECAVDDWLGEQGYDLTFLGTRASESKRRKAWLTYAHVEFGSSYPVKAGTGRRCCPIWDWTEDDVWALIAGWKLAYNPVYDVLAGMGTPRERQRVGPLPLTSRSILEEGWPDILGRLEIRYGAKWR